METSKEYIKMCEKAVEVQELPRNNDYVIEGCFCSIKEKVYVVMCDRDEKIDLIKYRDYNSVYQIHISKVIWLPRQDQLQGMVVQEGESSYELIERFKDICWHDEYNMYGRQFLSMEQLWLAFVMKERWNKTWNGKDWI